MRFIVTGGGTGGHIYPALAIARGLKNRHPQARILYIGTARGMEADIIPREGLAFQGISSAGLERRITWRNLLVLWHAGRGFYQARRAINRFRPDAVIGTGGYVCGPVVLAAATLRIPTVIHEQNALPGITNRMLARFAGRVALTFADSSRFFSRKDKLKLTGLPVRPEILRAERKKGRLEFAGLPAGRLTLLSFGGSRGARNINRAMVGVIKHFQEDSRLNILHVTGKAGYEEFIKECADAGIHFDNINNVSVMPYIYNMQDALTEADLVISRAGAATLAELTIMGIPALLVPYPYAAENHQEYNARALEREGAALVVLDRDLKGDMLCKEVTALLDSPERLELMASASKKLGRPRALEELLDSVDEVIKEKMKNQNK